MKLSEFIRQNTEQILEDFEQFADSLVTSDGWDRAELRDSAADMLAAIADATDLHQSDEARRAKSRGQDVESAVSRSARDHASDRRSQQFTLNQVVAEYRAMRLSVMQRWLTVTDRDDEADRAEQLARFNEALDESLAASTAWYDSRLRQSTQEQDRLVDALRGRQERLVSVIDQLPVGVGGLDADGNWVLANPMMKRYVAGKQIPSLDPEDKVRWTVVDAEGSPVPGEQWPAARALRGETVVPGIECLCECADGTARWLAVSAVPLGDNTFGARAIVVAQDISEQKRAEERVRAEDRAKQEFLAVLGHELRNPLAPIRTGLDLLGRVRQEPELVDTVRPMMERQFSHLVRLVDELLDISRISRGRVQIHRAPLDMNGPIQAAVEQVEGQIRERRHQLEVKLAPVPLPVEGDFERLTQVMANLIANAAKYMEPGGTIFIESDSADGQVVVRVRDTGYGFAAENRERLFELFSQIAEHQVRTGGGGLGVGLALSQRLVQMHGGAIDAESAGDGQGALFTVSLPLKEAADDAAASDSGSSPSSERSPTRILVVDDNRDAADGLKLILDVQGHETAVAYDGETALELVETFRPQVVLLDLGLPGMDGVEVGRKIRQLPGGDEIKLVAVTGWGQESDRARTADAGFQAHLVKPVALDQLTQIIATT